MSRRCLICAAMNPCARHSDGEQSRELARNVAATGDIELGVAIGASSSTPEVVEAAAEHVYEAMRWAAAHAESGSSPPWVPNGNSDAQYEARKAARAIAALPPSNSPDGGRSPSGPGSRASHEAAISVASSPEASIPNAATVYVVTRSVGEYSDRSETAAAVFVNEADAKQFVEAASSQAREAEKRFPLDYTTYDGGETIKLRQSVMTLDPDGADDYDTPCYYCAPCAFFASFASAIEAREGGDATEIAAPSSDESAVPEGQTPEIGIPSNMIGEAIEALEPFAALAEGEVAEQFTDGVTWMLANGERRFGAISMHALRKARATLSKLRGEG